jgi:DNA-binding transcriptional MerR regulator
VKPRETGALKIGALAKAAGVLEVAEVTAAGYQLFAADMVKRCAEIKRMQGERLTLKEIAGRLGRSL